MGFRWLVHQLTKHRSMHSQRVLKFSLVLGFVLVSHQNSVIYRQNKAGFLMPFSTQRASHAPCLSSRGYRGICSTTAECSFKAGNWTENCSRISEVCCVRVVSMCGSTVRDNNTYWENPGGIDGYNVTSFCPLNVEKNIASVCQIRLDFIPMILSDPDQNPGTATRCLVDFLTVSGASNIVPNICGHNMNQHMYLGITASNKIGLHIYTTTDSSFKRFWVIQITQVPCGTIYTAPSNCLQWFQETSGFLRSFNHQLIAHSSVQHLANQDYTICIRQNAGFCGISYEVCESPAILGPSEQFALSAEIIGRSLIDFHCLSDFIEIPCATDWQNSSQKLSNGAGCSSKICGSKFSAVLTASAPEPIFSYRRPFELRFYTDDSDSTAEEGIGFCLKYTQLPCSTDLNGL